MTPGCCPCPAALLLGVGSGFAGLAVLGGGGSFLGLMGFSLGGFGGGLTTVGFLLEGFTASLPFLLSVACNRT